MSSCFRRAQFACLLVFLEIFQCASVPASEPQDELRAAVVLSFLRYSEWPPGYSDAGPITVGVLGRPSFVQVLRRVLDGKSVKNRPIRTLELTAVNDPNCCQIIYLATENSAEIKQALLNCQSAHVLTMGDGNKFLEAGGAVRLTTLDGHMSFEVNLDAVGHAGVVISSTLLRYGETKGRRRT